MMRRNRRPPPRILTDADFADFEADRDRGRPAGEECPTCGLLVSTVATSGCGLKCIPEANQPCVVEEFLNPSQR